MRAVNKRGCIVLVMATILMTFCLLLVQSVSAVQVSEGVKFQTTGTNTTFIMGNDFTFGRIEVHSTYLMLGTATISVHPSVGSINFTLFNFSIEYMKWNESCSNPDAIANHTMGGLKTNASYLVNVNGAIYGYYTSNESGYVFFTYSGGYSDIVFEMKVTPGADLEITEIWVNWPECHEPAINCTICYNVTNIGNGTVPAGHNTSLYVDDIEVALDYVPEELAPGENYIGCFDGYIWTYTPPEDNITVCADCNNTVAESNETNNCMINTWMCGDVNEDHTVNVLDVLGVYRRALDPGYPLKVPWAADVNCDGKINVLDVLGVYRRALDPGYELDCCCE